MARARRGLGIRVLCGAGAWEQGRERGMPLSGGGYPREISDDYGEESRLMLRGEREGEREGEGEGEGARGKHLQGRGSVGDVVGDEAQHLQGRDGRRGAASAGT